MANSIFIKADELAKELDISQGLAYKMIAQWNEELRAKGYTTVGGRVSRRYYQEKIMLGEKLIPCACETDIGIFPGTLNRPLRILYLKKICLL